MPARARRRIWVALFFVTVPVAFLALLGTLNAVFSGAADLGTDLAWFLPSATLAGLASTEIWQADHPRESAVVEVRGRIRAAIGIVVSAAMVGIARSQPLLAFGVFAIILIAGAIYVLVYWLALRDLPRESVKGTSTGDRGLEG